MTNPIWALASDELLLAVTAQFKEADRFIPTARMEGQIKAGRSNGLPSVAGGSMRIIRTHLLWALQQATT